MIRWLETILLVHDQVGKHDHEQPERGGGEEREIEQRAHRTAAVSSGLPGNEVRVSAARTPRPVAATSTANAPSVHRSGSTSDWPRNACHVTSPVRARVRPGRDEDEVGPDPRVGESRHPAGRDGEGQRQQGQCLQRVNSHEVRDAQVAAGRAPAGERHARPAVDHADAVGTHAVHHGPVAHRLELAAGRFEHQKSEADPHGADQDAEADGPHQRPVRRPVPEQQEALDHPEHPHGRDGRAHEVVQRAVQRRGGVEVTRTTTEHLADDDRHLGREQHRHHRARPPQQPGPPALSGQQPGPREAVQDQGDGELERLEPEGFAGHHAVVEQQAADRHDRGQQHQTGEDHQRSVPGPHASRHVGKIHLRHENSSRVDGRTTIDTLTIDSETIKEWPCADR